MNVDEDGHLLEPELVKWDTHVERLRNGYRRYWEARRQEIDDGPSSACPWFEGRTAGELQKTKALAEERLRLIERGLFLRPLLSAKWRVANLPYTLDFSVFGKLIFTMRNPAVRKVRVRAFDKYVRARVISEISEAWRTFWTPHSTFSRVLFEPSK